MQISTLILIALTAIGPVAAFTNGTLVPAYICNPRPDGLPKSFGQLLPYTREQLEAVAFNANPGDNLGTAPAFNATAPSMVANSAYILASFHNTLNSLAAIEQGLVVTIANGSTSFKAGTTQTLILSSGNTTVNLDGALLYAEEGEQRVGSFTDKGGMFANFPGCGKSAGGKIAGVIQTAVIACTSTYDQLQFNVPLCVASGTITLAGLSVTDAGFGVWKYNFPVTGSVCTGVTDAQIVEIIQVIEVANGIKTGGTGAKMAVKKGSW